VIDACVLVREFLLGQSQVTTLLGTNPNGSIYCASDLPEGFDPKNGPAIQIFRVGGAAHGEITRLVDARLQVRAWADVEQYTLAATIYAAINDVLHGLCDFTLTDGTIVRAFEANAGEMTDPDTGWVSSHAFYSILARPNVSGEAPEGPPQFTQGSGFPETIGNDGDVYYDTASGNLYEQVSGSWGSPVGTITGGGGDDMTPSLIFHRVALASNNAVAFKNVAGLVTGWQIFNDTEYPVYVKLYNKATTPNPASDTPKQVIGIQAGQSAEFAGSFTYDTGIGMAIVKGSADNDNTPVALGDCVADIFYQ